MEPELVPQWSLTDEEWCELCFMIFELGETHQRLQEALLSEERPSLHQLWVQGSAFQRESQALFAYLGGQLRNRALTGERRAA